MASWRDGAAYAPVERPDGFATPDADPLPSGAPYRPETPGPMAAPSTISGPPVRRELADLGSEPPATRDPRDPFAVSSLAMTAGPDAASRRDPRQPFVTSATLDNATDAPLGPPTGPPLAPPTGPPLAGPGPYPVTPSSTALPQHIGQYGAQGRQPGAPQTSPSGYPAPGGTPGYPTPNQPTRQQLEQRRLAQLGGALAFAGFLFSTGAPFLLIIAGALGIRTVALTGRLGAIALTTGIVLVLLQLMTGSLGQSSWLAATVSLGFAIAYFIGALRKS